MVRIYHDTNIMFWNRLVTVDGSQPIKLVLLRHVFIVVKMASKLVWSDYR